MFKVWWQLCSDDDKLTKHFALLSVLIVGQHILKLYKPVGTCVPYIRTWKNPNISHTIQPIYLDYTFIFKHATCTPRRTLTVVMQHQKYFAERSVPVQIKHTHTCTHTSSDLYYNMQASPRAFSLSLSMPKRTSHKMVMVFRNIIL